jgi:DNA polymerase-3 subunit epsilon
MQRTFDDLGMPLADVTFCVIDLETTGGDRGNDLITEVGAVKVCGGECLGTFQTLVNPGRAIPATITILTGITNSMVLTAPRIEGVLAALLEFCGDAVIVGHNVRFDVGFLNAALTRSRRPTLTNATVDTVALARRLVRDEVPNCKLGTLAARFRLAHQPSHRALDDALATADLLHLLIERAATFGVMGLDDLHGLPKIGGHPQIAKLKLTNHLPRTPGVYLFHNAAGEVLYVGKATNLRQRVRSYFGSEDRRKIGPMLREAQRVTHVETPDVLTAEILELRYLHQLSPRYNKQGTTWDKYRYVRLSTNEAQPRLSIVKEADRPGMYLGPLSSRSAAAIVIDAIHTVVPLRGCLDAVTDSNYADAVNMVMRGLTHEPEVLLAPLRERMLALARAQQYEQAAAIRDRAQALSNALRRQRLIDHVRAAEQLDLRIGDVTFEFDHGRLIDSRLDGTLTAALEVPPPELASLDRPLPRHAVDETLCIARYLDSNSHQISLLRCSGQWARPLAPLATFEQRSAA